MIAISARLLLADPIRLLQFQQEKPLFVPLRSLSEVASPMMNTIALVPLYQPHPPTTSLLVPRSVVPPHRSSCPFGPLSSLAAVLFVRTFNLPRRKHQMTFTSLHTKVVFYCCLFSWRLLRHSKTKHTIVHHPQYDLVLSIIINVSHG